MRAKENEMHEMRRLVAWLARLDAIAAAVGAHRMNAMAPFRNSDSLKLLEQMIGWHVVEVV